MFDPAEFLFSCPCVADQPEIEALLDLCFGRDRHGKASYQFRGRPPVPGLSRIVRRHGELVGTIAYWPVTLGDAREEMLLLGPIAVAPSLQGTGLGGALMRETLARAAAAGYRVVFLVGDIGYYARFGFGRDGLGEVTMPNERPERLLVRGLVEGATEGLAGVLRPVPEAPAMREPRRAIA